MHPESLDCPSPAHQGPSDCLAAPAAAGQGMGTKRPCYEQQIFQAGEWVTYGWNSVPKVPGHGYCAERFRYRLCDQAFGEPIGDWVESPAAAVQEVGTPTLDQFQRWLETEAHTAYQQLSLGFAHESFQDETDRCRKAQQRIASCRLATLLLMEFQA